MKRIYNIIGIALMAVAIMSCGGQQKQGTKFQPKERESSMSDSERKAAIAQKKAELGGLNLDTLLYSHGVKFSIVQPKVQGEDITQDIADRIVMKMLQIACQNGISGLGTNPGFVLGTEIAQTGRAATATTPQKMTVKYDLTFKVMNTVTGDVSCIFPPPASDRRIPYFSGQIFSHGICCADACILFKKGHPAIPDGPLRHVSPQ